MVDQIRVGLAQLNGIEDLLAMLLDDGNWTRTVTHDTLQDTLQDT